MTDEELERAIGIDKPTDEELKYILLCPKDEIGRRVKEVLRCRRTGERLDMSVAQRDRENCPSELAFLLDDDIDEDEFLKLVEGRGTESDV
jgi:hypothetical protein